MRALELVRTGVPVIDLQNNPDAGGILRVEGGGLDGPHFEAAEADEAAGFETAGEFEVGGVFDFLLAKQVHSAHKDQRHQKQQRGHDHHHSDLNLLVGTRHKSFTS